MGRRVGKKINGKLVQMWVWQSQLQIAAELDSKGRVVKQFVYGSKVNVPDYMIAGGKTYSIITDQLGSPRLVVDSASGRIAQEIEYDEFGVIAKDSEPGFTPFGFAGGMYDQHTKLVRFGVRDYDPEVGRWTSKDPIGFAGGDTNLFAYVISDPINFLDPDGRALIGADYSGQGLLGNAFRRLNRSQLGRKILRTLENRKDIYMITVYDDLRRWPTFDESDNEIILRPDGLKGSTFFQVLAHEIGHAYLNGGTEAQADAIAATIMKEAPESCSVKK